MRIGPETVIQVIDGASRDEDRLVVSDDMGNEVVIHASSWPLLAYAVTYLTGDQNGVALGIHEHEFATKTIGTDGTGQPVRIRECACRAVAGYTGETA
ncbi:hypothetical protein PQD13_gp81 [Gordonia phage Clawz]|uniref:Uncharacterized protein n=1 Tax=Gordonia phage Clawz TaxID=2743910 RepID=A0AAE7F866_9CAUD|nr:hypothetical protein PQD13_gp81 [Gordonia phage Clawz]QKY79993.1 hypothetical protein SEA_CLAWZ_81 [Gordonia phage Clawz]